MISRSYVQSLIQIRQQEGSENRRRKKLSGEREERVFGAFKFWYDVSNMGVKED